MKRSTSERWVVWMPCKSYVKRWLLLNYNSPSANWPEIVRLSPNRVLWSSFLSRLKHGSRRRDKERRCAYRDTVAIEISEDVFRRYGWELTDTELTEMNRILEHEVKSAMRSFVAALSMAGLPLSECIRRYRASTGMTELDWETDSIRKDVTRHLRLPGQEYYAGFLAKIEEKVWEVLSVNGQLTERGLMSINHQQTIYGKNHL